MPSSSHRRAFNPDFDKEYSDGLILDMQRWCFNDNCGKDNPPKRCVKCKLAAYCNRECQVADWNFCHKERCKIWRENRAAKPDGTPPTCVPIALKSVHCVNEMAVHGMIQTRQHLFLEELKRCKITWVKLETSVVKLLRSIRLVCGASFWGEPMPYQGRAMFVNHLVAEIVDEVNDQTMAKLYPDGAGEGIAGGRPGSISSKARKKVLEKWVEFAKKLRQYKFSLIEIQYGRGLMYLKDENDEFWVQVKQILEDGGPKVKQTLAPCYMDVR
jgi:hypothetical protein